MAAVALLFVYLFLTLPIGLAAAFVGATTRRYFIQSGKEGSGVTITLAAALCCVSGLAIAWALLGDPLPNGRPEPSELFYLFTSSSPIVWINDREHFTWWALVECVNLLFFATVGALIFAPRRDILNAAFVFALLVLVAIPAALVWSIPPCRGCTD